MVIDPGIQYILKGLRFRRTILTIRAANRLERVRVGVTVIVIRRIHVETIVIVVRPVRGRTGYRQLGQGTARTRAVAVLLQHRVDSGEIAPIHGLRGERDRFQLNDVRLIVPLDAPRGLGPSSGGSSGRTGRRGNENCGGVMACGGGTERRLAWEAGIRRSIMVV
jgi:hypothetical protein